MKERVRRNRPSGGGPQAFDNGTGLGANDEAAFAETPLSLSVLLAEDVSAECTALRGLSRGRHFEALLHPFVCLLLWHFLTTVLEVGTERGPKVGDGEVRRVCCIPQGAFTGIGPHGRQNGAAIEAGPETQTVRAASRGGIIALKSEELPAIPEVSDGTCRVGIRGPQRGASTIVMARPSIFGSCSTFAISSSSCCTPSRISMPRSWWACSRPRKMMLTFTLSL